MDVISYGAARQAEQIQNDIAVNVLGPGIEGTFPHTKDRIDALETKVQNVVKQADDLIVKDSVNIMKAHAKLNSIAKTMKYKMENMLFDDLLDLSGIDTSKSSHYEHDPSLGLLKSDGNTFIVETISEETDSVPERVILTLELVRQRLATHFSQPASSFARVTAVDPVRVPRITIEFWLKLDSETQSNAAILSNTEAGGYSVYVTKNKITTSFRIGSTYSYRVVSLTLDNPTEWNHLAFTFDGQKVIGYLNGVPVSSLDAEGDIIYSTNTYLTFFAEPNGTSNSLTSGCAGAMADLRIWNYARSADDIVNNLEKELVGNEAGLVAYWKMDEKEGSIMKDYAHGYDATLFGAYTRLDDYPDIQSNTSSAESGSGLFNISRDDGNSWESIDADTLFYFNDNLSPLDKRLKLKMEIPATTQLLNYALTWV